MRRCPPPPSALRKIGQPNCSVLSQPPENGYTIPHTVRYHAAFTFVLRFVFSSEKENRPERRHSEKRTNSRRTRVPLVRARKPVYLEERTVEPYYADWLSLLPPIIAISLALITKEVISSLLIGILSGTLIYTIGSGSGSPIVGTVEATFTIMTAKVDFDILIFCTLLGALVYTISMAGGTRAYGNWAIRRIKSKRSALLSTGALGAVIFIDDYFNCLTVGTVMKPVTDSYKISRAKLAYIIDATAAPICIIAPISSWAAAVGSNLRSTGAFESDFAAFVSTIPYNFYALLSIVMVVMVCTTNCDFGLMLRSERRALKGDLGAVDTYNADHLEGAAKGTVLDMLIPIGSLIVFAVLGLLYNGGYWGDDPAYHTLGAAFGNCTAAKALVWASFGALVVAFLLFVPRRLMGLRTFMDGAIEGMKAMLPANAILVLAWTISGVCRDLLQTPIFVKTLVADGGVSGGLLPAAIFIIAGFLSFSTGTAWGTFGILIPIVVPVAQAVDPDLVVVCLSATLAGSVFGDHCSPISDTTILSSAGSGCNHIEHVSTQLGYAFIVGGCCIVGYLVAGFTEANLWLSLGSSLVLLIAAVAALHFWSEKRNAALAD